MFEFDALEIKKAELPLGNEYFFILSYKEIGNYGQTLIIRSNRIFNDSCTL